MKNKYWSSKRYPTKKYKGTVFLFPAGFTYLWMYRLPIYLLSRNGYEVLGFSIKWKKGVKELEFKDLISMFEEMNKFVKDSFQNEGKYTVFGTSFGGVIATYVAKRNKEIESMILNLTHGSSANLFWDYKPTKKIIQKLKDEGISSEQELSKITEPIESSKDIELLKDRKIVVFVSLNDKVTKDNFGTATALQKVNPNVIIYTTKLGHFSGAIKNIMTRKKWMKVLP